MKPKHSKKKKVSKKKRVSKSGITEGGNYSKIKKKGISPECISESSSLKRKKKNMSKSPRNNNIEDLMQQFLNLKSQNNDGELMERYTRDGYGNPNFSKEQTNSILNISSQGGANMSFIN